LLCLYHTIADCEFIYSIAKVCILIQNCSHIMKMIIDGVEIHVSSSHQIKVLDGVVIISPRALAAISPPLAAISPPPAAPPPISDTGLFRKVRGMVMLMVSDSSAFWLFSPDETFLDVWSLSDYAVDDDDLRASLPCKDKLFTHYGFIDEDKELVPENMEVLPYQYYDYVTQKNSHLHKDLQSVFDIALYRGTQQSRKALEELITTNHVLVPIEDALPVTCDACKMPNRAATFRLGHLSIGRTCAAHIAPAITAWEAYRSLGTSIVPPFEYAHVRDIIKNALTSKVSI
jgi:hypothetical protein